MKTLILLLSLLTFKSLNAHESYPERSDWEVISKTKDSTLKPNRTRITFLFNGLDLDDGKQRMVWSANKFIDTTFIDYKSNSISKVFISGNYNFKFYANSRYREIIIPKLKLDSGYAITVELNFKTTERNMQVKKPVIYLYPQEPTSVHLKVKPEGTMTFTYPEHGKDGWEVMAHPDGNLMINDESLNYLFWEAEQPFSRDDFDLSSGALVSKNETVNFLKESLTQIGLNSKEQADFITFWGPQLQQHEQNFIHFVLNDDASVFGELEVTPSPDHIYRVYLIFFDATVLKGAEVIPQVLPTLVRDGFTLIEWGGSELTEISL